MQRGIGGKLRKEFERTLLQRLPGWRPVRPAEVPPGWTLYESGCGGTGKFRAFIVLAVSTIRDACTIELAWSEDGRFPAFLIPMMPLPSPRHGITRADEPENGAFRFRLSFLWSPGVDVWWPVAAKPDLIMEEMLEELLPGSTRDKEASKPIAEVVDEMITRIQEFGIPYFENVVRVLQSRVET